MSALVGVKAGGAEEDHEESDDEEVPPLAEPEAKPAVRSTLASTPAPRAATWHLHLRSTPSTPHSSPFPTHPQPYIKPSLPIQMPSQEPEVDTTLANSDVNTKHVEAAKIANLVLQEVANLCIAGARIVDICRAGDDSINAKVTLNPTPKP